MQQAGLFTAEIAEDAEGPAIEAMGFHAKPQRRKETRAKQAANTPEGTQGFRAVLCIFA
jgi:hypothetical protein